MGRIIGSVIAGYLAMFVLVFALFSLAYTVLGASGAFHPGSWDVAGSWVALTIVIGLAAAVVGGYICAAIARDRRGPLWLVALVIVLGLLFAIPVLTGGAPAAAGPRPDAVPMFEAMSKAVQPTWVALLNPLLGAVGVLIGARLRGPGSA